ncbi:MAG TPA: ATP-binding cassette domain-containing protein, partial [Terriglobales bacterium]|nr:ATP-binding cassette domain-containing protein [Terriglobales bacterium]
SELTLRIGDGELVVVVGPSGCGKSTLLRLIAGLEEVSEGELRIGGRSVNQLSPRQRNVAMVFQDYALYPNMTVRGNLEFPLKMAKLDSGERERRVQWVSEMLGLDELLARMPRQLSGGQRQRVAMGRALVRDPAVFLLDEPLSNLDAKLRSQVRAEIAELQQRMKSTMIYVTHDQVEAMTLGDRVAVLNRGELQQVAPPQELYDRPANAFVAGFIGNPPMNLLSAAFSASDGGLRLQLGEQQLQIPEPQASALLALERSPQRFGIRPEDLSLASGALEQALRVQVTHAEYLGYETLVYAAAGSERVIARLPGTIQFDRDAPIHLQPDWSKVHFFHADGSRMR